MGYTPTFVSARRDSSSTYGRSCLTPSAQLRLMVMGRACRTEAQKASTVWPDSVRPEASVIVPEMMMGRSTPEASMAARAA